MNEKKAIYLFILGCLIVIIGLVLNEYEIVKDYTLVYVGIVIESASIFSYAYRKINKSK